MTNRLPRYRDAIAGLLVLVVAGCGGATHTPTANASTVRVEPTAPALPEDPLALLPANPQQLVRVDLAALRGSRHFVALRSLAKRHACGVIGKEHFLLERSEQAVLGIYREADGRARSVVILRGSFANDDARAALFQGRAVQGQEAIQTTEKRYGRFTVLSDGAYAAATLSRDLLVAGDPAAVQSVLSIAEGKQASWLAQDASGTAAWLKRHTVSAVADLDDSITRAISRMAANIGAKGLAHGLSESSAKLGITLADELNAELTVDYADAKLATHSAEQVRSLIGQTGFVLRLVGFGALTRMRISAEGKSAIFTIRLSAQEIDDWIERLSPLIGVPECKPETTMASSRQ